MGLYAPLPGSRRSIGGVRMLMPKVVHPYTKPADVCSVHVVAYLATASTRITWRCLARGRTLPGA